VKGSAPEAYWEERARLFAASGEGLRAVCSYGMPAFYNRFIDLTQRLALRRWLLPRPGQSVLDVGCGVGRWSRLLARRGARVTGVDLSPTMVEEGRRRALRDGLADRCRLEVNDIADLNLKERFSLILGVTVLQHVLDEVRLERAVRALAAHVEDGGRIALLEAAPTGANHTCDTAIFRARTSAYYLDLFTRCGLRLVMVQGVDPAPFKIWLLPFYRRLPPIVGNSLLAIATLASLPLDGIFGRRLVAASWHKVFVLEKNGGDRE
jgi:SAM-dependent methyltransferase